MNKSIMAAMGFGKQVAMVEGGQCPLCGKKIKDAEFKDELSAKEYQISGMCQTCQDKIFEV